MSFPLTARLLSAATFAAAAVFGSPAALAQGTFTAADTGSTCSAGGQGTLASSITCTKGSVTATITAWGFTGATLSSTAAAGFAAGSVADWDANGLGAITGANETGYNSHHALDNSTTNCGSSGASTNTGCGGSIEGLLLNFNSAVNLNALSMTQWGDADFSLWVWQGTGAAPTSLTGVTASTTQASGSALGVTGAVGGTLSSGWRLVTSQDLNNPDAANGASLSANTANTFYSSAWLISTYFGPASGSLESGNDAFKITSFTVAKAPEPGSLALLGVAALAALAVRRRKPRQTAAIVAAA